MNYIYKRILSNGRYGFMIKEEQSNRFVALVNREDRARDIVVLLNADAKESEDER